MEGNAFFFQETRDGRLHMVRIPNGRMKVEHHTKEVIPVTIEFLESIYEGYFLLKDIHMQEEEKESISFVLENRILSLHVHIAGNDISVTYSYKNIEK